MPRCSACGVHGEPGASFCQACGAALAGPAPEESAARKVVTIVFADLAGSTPLQERLDPESSRRFMDRYYEAMRAAVEGQRGTVTQLLGDGVKAVFGIPRVAEDDAIRAVRAAVAMQRAFSELMQGQGGLAGEIGLRVAVNTGEVIVSAEKEIIGDPVNVAAHLQSLARVGDVLIAEPTRRLVGDLVTLAPLGAFAVKGRAERVPAYRVVALERPAGASATPFVGRENELARVRAIYDDAVASRRARLAVILGSPGLGKSRLIGEVARRLGDAAMLLLARCDAAGGATFAPVAAALRALLHLDDGVSGEPLHAAIHAATMGDEAERARIAAAVAALLGGAPKSPEETFFAVRRFLAGLASQRPVVLVVDDLQWAEPLLLDLLEHLVQWTSDAPLLVLVGARPDLRDARSSLTVAGGLVADVVTLAGLDAAAATRLAANAIGADELPAAIAGRVLTASEGNPLFVGELVRMLVQDGILRREGDRWTTSAAVAALEMPPTIQALLAARIERLRPAERTVLERAAVVGRQFSRAAVAELLPRDVADLDRHLEALRRSELIEPDTGWFLGEPALRFHHVLTRDAAYRRLLKNRRAELHERFADWVLEKVGDAPPHDETIGWHLEQAHQHLSELGPIDARGRALGERAARYLGAAGRRALERDDLPVAASLLGRAIAQLDEADAARADLALDWCEALLSAGEVSAAAAALDELGRFANASRRLRAWHTCFAGQRAALTDPESLRGTAAAVASAAEALAAEGDTAGEAKGHLVHAIALARLGRMGACEAALDRAQAAARRARDRRLANTVLAGVPLAALWGPSPVTRASGRCLDVVRVLRITQGSPAVEAVALRSQGVLEALRGRSEAARRMVSSSRRMVEELGITQRLLEADVFAGRIELIEGDAAAAERCLRPAYEGLREHGLGIDAARAAALLGRALLALDRAAEAEVLSRESEKLAGDDLEAAIAWRGVRAEALARRGEHAEAIDLARAAVDLAAATDALLFHADARTALATALRTAGRSAEADAEGARAIELREAKGATRIAERARREAGRVAAGQRSSPAPPVRARWTRRVRPNAAVENATRLERAVASRDAGALPALIGDEFEEAVDHTTGATYGREGLLVSWESTIRSKGGACHYEPLATLGNSLALAQFSRWGSETRWRPPGLTGKAIEVGAYEADELHLLESDARGRFRRCEIFPSTRLGDALVRLYARHAEFLPDGPERERAAATARSAAAILGPYDLTRYATAFAPAIAYVDHRIQGVGPLTGRPELLEWLLSLLEVADDIANRFDDVLGFCADGLLLRWTNSGRERAGGGGWERPLLWLGVVGAEGLFTRVELFEGDAVEEALARFDELTAEAPRPVLRQVRPNAATEFFDRLCAAVAARESDALVTLFVDPMDAEVVHHPTGSVYDLEGLLWSYRELMRLPDAALEIEPLATLGDSLALSRHGATGSGTTWGFEVGAFELEHLLLVEVAEDGRGRCGEVFAADRLRDAVVRLYERYADLMPEGPARERAATTARSVAASFGDMPTLERDRASLAPQVEATDHRALFRGSARGAETLARIVAAQHELEEDLRLGIDEVLALRPDTLLVQQTTTGTIRASGGRFERSFLVLLVFGSDGRIARWDRFDPEAAAEALARFDELGPGPAAGFENIATKAMERLALALNARDWPRIEALVAPGFRLVDERKAFRLELDREEFVGTMRPLLALESSHTSLEVLATRGERLALGRHRWRGGGGDVGASEIDYVFVFEANELGELVRLVRFDLDDLDAAHAELDARYRASPSTPFATSTQVKRAVAARDWDGLAALYAPGFVLVDHRPLGWGTLGSTEHVESLKALAVLAPDAGFRTDHVRQSGRAALVVHVLTGTREGGAFEEPRVLVSECDEQGRYTRLEFYTLDQLDLARARFAELCRP